MTFERRVRLAQLPEMRLAYLEHAGALDGIPDLWQRFESWRIETRPSPGRVDIASIGWLLNPGAAEGAAVEYRACLPLRSDGEVKPPARSTFFPGGLFAYCYADDPLEIEEAFEAVSSWLESEPGWQVKGAMEVYRYHFNIDQHPVDCGFLIERVG